MNTKVIHAEWIGKQITITHSTNKTQIGITGTIVDETKQLITIQTQTGEKRVPKSGITFKIDGEEIKGNDVLSTPEERIKLKPQK